MFFIVSHPADRADDVRERFLGGDGGAYADILFGDRVDFDGAGDVLALFLFICVNRNMTVFRITPLSTGMINIDWSKTFLP